MAIRHRYLQDRCIYTFLGQTLIAVNPFHRLPIYGKETLQHFKALDSKIMGKSTPHIYEIARQAENLIRQTQTSQGVLITGESGAGKTETLKYLV
jgi:myosin heavy subunit